MSIWFKSLHSKLALGGLRTPRPNFPTHRSFLNLPRREIDLLNGGGVTDFALERKKAKKVQVMQ